MIATLINVALVLLGSAIGLLFKNRISPRFSKAIIAALGLCVIGLGISNLLESNNALCVIICMVVGTLIGEALNIDAAMNRGAERLRRAMTKNGKDNSRFVEGFVSSTVLFCVGALAVNGALQAGLNHNYSILISKGVIDGITAITFSAAYGIGVAFAAIPLLIYEGAITLFAQVIGPYLGDAVVAEMSAVGGTIIVGIGINMLGLPKEKLRVANMLPAIFLPIAYLPLSSLLTGLWTA
ncbi:MAG: DUF554 domain-containing protein [Oscillospiraceae bacterium]|nr:DUF554 domain-containing protein [Oscillospiraceae bacterium]